MLDNFALIFQTHMMPVNIYVIQPRALLMKEYLLNEFLSEIDCKRTK